MAVSSGFFNSVNHDRLYDAEQISSIFDGVINDGVYESIGSAFRVSGYSEANDTVIVGSGRAWFNHTWTLNDSDYALTIEAPNNFMDRVDAIVIDIDRSEAVRKNSILYVAGTPGTPALPPSLINTDTHKQYPIAYITRKAGVSAPVSDADIQYLVGKSSCPLVTGPLNVINSDNFFAQMTAEFEEWFNGIKDTMDENVVTNILHKIDELKNQLEEQSQQVGLLTKDAYDIFKKGPVDLNIETYRSLYYNPSSVISDTTYPTLYNNGYVKISGSQTGSIREAGFPVVSFLPNGKVFRFYAIKGGNVWNAYYYTITNTEGVVEKYEKLDLTDTSINWGVDTGYFSVANINFDSFPCYFDMVSETAGRAAKISITRISISSDNIVYNNTKFVDLTVEGATYLPSATNSSNVAMSIVPATFSDGSSLFAVTSAYDYGSDARGWFINTFLTVTSDGVSKKAKSVVYGSNTNPVDAMNTEGMIFASPGTHSNGYIYSARWFVLGVTDDDEAIAVNSSGYQALNSTLGSNRGININITDSAKSTYNVTDSEGTATDKRAATSSSEIPNFHIGPKKQIFGNSYTLSEVNGVTTQAGSEATYLVEKNGIDVASQRVSDYFLGASNKATDIPEGTFMAFKNPQGTLIGISPSGGVEIIGSNGGAALFKNSSASIDISRPTSGDADIKNPLYLISPFVNHIELDGKVGYLYARPFFISMVGNYDTDSDITTEVITNHRSPSVVPRVIWMEEGA